MLFSIFKSKKSKTIVNPRTRKSSLSIESLEMREVPAGISLDATTHLLTITGDAGNDMGVVRPASVVSTVNGASVSTTDPTRLDVIVQTSTGYQQQLQFSTSSVSKILFNGKGGADVFVNATTIPATTQTTATGTVSTSVLPGSPGNLNTNDVNNVGVFVAGSTGQVQVDYLYCGAGYKGQMGIYSLEGMDQYAAGSTAYIKEAARRILSNSTDGYLAINRQVEQARYGVSLPWEGYLNSGGTYLGPRTFQMKPNAQFATMLVPNGTVQQIFNSPGSGGSLTPLFSIPKENPYPVTSQMQGQIGDLTGAGSIFAYEDIRLDQGSDRDYNDMVFQVIGARGTATPVKDVVNANRDFMATDVGHTLGNYASTRIASDTTVSGVFTGGKYQVAANGKVGVDYLFDSGGFVGQMGVFSLSGMNAYKPGSQEFIQEAARRVISNSTLGAQVINDYTEGARYATGATLMQSFNAGAYQGVKTLNMAPGDTVAFMLIPNGTTWEAFTGTSSDPTKRALFSMADANPAGANQFADTQGTGTVLAFEDARLDGANPNPSDKDYNDIVFRTYGLTPLGTTPTVSELAVTGRDWTQTDLGKTIRNNSVQPW
ncbi:MAG: DUF4114 domain-containing protein [Gemmataceae bacterium]